MKITLLATGFGVQDIHIFTMEDLDNDNVINMVETVPTYKRSKETLESIQSKVMTENDQFDSYKENKNDNIITFNND